MIAERLLIRPQLEVLDTPKKLGRVVVEQNGAYQRVKDYYAGWHPDIGTLHMGYTGKETIVEKDVITPTVVFDVKAPSLKERMLDTIRRTGDY